MEHSCKVSEDLVLEIISRLPVKDLMRFASVSKSWLSLISSDSHFSDLQFQRAASSGPPLVILKTVPYPDSYRYWFDLDSLEEPDKDVAEIHNPFHDNDHDTRFATQLLCSCDGLLVLRQHRTLSLALLNPSTRKYHLVPPNPAGNENATFAGFGYDHESKLYKLVTVTCPLSIMIDGFVDLMIYDVNGKWRERRCLLKSDSLSIMASRLCIDMQYGDVFVGNASYWAFRFSFSPMRIIGFSLANEELFEVSRPDLGPDLFAKIVEFDGRVCLACEMIESDDGWVRKGNEKERTDVFVLEEERWVKLFSISDPKNQLGSFDSDCRICPTPLFYSSCRGKVLFSVNYEKLVWYNLKTKEFEGLNNPVKESCVLTPCLRSLVGNGISEA